MKVLKHCLYLKSLSSPVLQSCLAISCKLQAVFCCFSSILFVKAEQKSILDLSVSINFM